MSHLSRWAIAVSVLWCTLLSTTSAHADDNTVAAGETFRAAEAAYTRGDFKAAAQSFEVSHRLVPHPNAIYNAGLAWQAAGELARAADALAEALAMDGISEAQAADGEARLAVLRPQLAVAVVLGPEGTRVTVAHALARPTPTSIHLRPGSYELTAELAGGQRVTRKLEVASPGAELEVDLTAEVPTVAPAPTPTTALPVPGPVPDPDAPSATQNEAQWVSGWVLAGAGVVAGGVAIGLGVAALQARDEFEASGNTDAGARDRAATLRTTTNVMWATAGVLALTGTLLLVFAGGPDEPENPPDAARVRIRPNPDGFTLTF